MFVHAHWNVEHLLAFRGRFPELSRGEYPHSPRLHGRHLVRRALHPGQVSFTFHCALKCPFWRIISLLSVFRSTAPLLSCWVSYAQTCGYGCCVCLLANVAALELIFFNCSLGPKGEKAIKLLDVRKWQSSTSQDDDVGGFCISFFRIKLFVLSNQEPKLHISLQNNCHQLISDLRKFLCWRGGHLCIEPKPLFYCPFVPKEVKVPCRETLTTPLRSSYIPLWCTKMETPTQCVQQFVCDHSHAVKCKKTKLLARAQCVCFLGAWWCGTFLLPHVKRSRS